MKFSYFQPKLFVTLTTFCTAAILTAQPAGPAKPDKQAPDTMQVAVALSGYGFIPSDSGGTFSQLFPKADPQIEIKKSIRRLPFGEIPVWSGTKDILLTGDYHVTIRAVYMEGQPVGDFVEKKKGLSLDISYYYDKKLIDFESTTVWDESNLPKASASLHDTDYIALLRKNSFEIPSSVDGYGDDGFRFWAAARDGLTGRDGKYTDKSLGDFLKPLDRKANRMIPIVKITCNML